MSKPLTLDQLNAGREWQGLAPITVTDGDVLPPAQAHNPQPIEPKRPTVVGTENERALETDLAEYRRRFRKEFGNAAQSVIEIGPCAYRGQDPRRTRTVQDLDCFGSWD
jgi:hypothetical protein